MIKNTFCSTLSNRRNDSLIGTATNYNKLLLIEYNKPWTQKAFVDSKIKSLVKKHVTDFINLNNVKLLLVKNQDSNENDIQIFTFNLDPDKNYSNLLVLKKYEDLLTINLNSYFENQIQPTNNLLYLVCTNGKKDKCCSKFGLPIYQELLKRNKNAWQCTHFGGDRFAPNILFLPYSLFFGHITINEVPDFIETVEQNKIYHTKYRGRSIYDNYEQAAEYFLSTHLNNFSINGLKLLDSHKLEEYKSVVLFSSRADDLQYEVEIEKRLSEKLEFLTCNANKASHIHIFKLLSVRPKQHRTT